MTRTVSKAERQKAYAKVFGAAVEAGSKYDVKDKVDGAYPQQVRTMKTKSDELGVSRKKLVEAKRNKT